MSTSTDTTGCLSHRPNTRFFVMHQDFLDVASVSEHQYKLAAFWRVLETKTNDRIKYNEEAKKNGTPVLDLWIEIPYSEFVSRSLGVYKSSAFQVAAAESERLGFSKSRIRKRPTNPNDPDSPQEEFKEYLFLTDVMQSVLNGGDYPTPIEINSPLLKSIALRKEQKKAIENNRDGIEINSPPIEINTKKNREGLPKYSEESSKEKDSKQSTVRDASASTPSQQSASFDVGDKSVENSHLSTQANDIPFASKQATNKRTGSTTRPSTSKTHSEGQSKKPTFDLTLQEKIFWQLWLEVFFNKDIPPVLNQRAYEHVQVLAPHITTKEQLDSLIEFARKDLEANQGISRKTLYLGNLRSSYIGWKQAQRPKEPVNIADHKKQDTISGRQRLQAPADALAAMGGI